MIAIVGGGITGLAAAYELSRRGVSFVLLEASDRFGGLVHTEHVDGFTIELGADSMLAEKPAAIELCQELGLESRLIATKPPRTAYIHARGTLFPIPSPSVFGIPTTIEAIETYALLSPQARARLKENFNLPPRRSAHDEPVAAFFRRQFGPDTVALIAEPLLAGIHAGDVERLSMAAVAPRLVQLEAEVGGVLNAFRDRPSSVTTDGPFRSLLGGMGELVKALVETLPDGSTWLASGVTGLTRDGRNWTVSTRANVFTTTAVIVAAPAHAASKLLAVAAPTMSALCAEMPYVSTASVALSWPRADVSHPLPGTGFVVARRESALRITACSWVTSKWVGRAPDEMTLIRAFLGGATDPDVATYSDADLIAITARDISAAHGITAPPLLSRVHRWIDAGAQHTVGHGERLLRIEAQLDDTPGLFVAGSGFRSIGVPDCVAEGRRAAAAAADYVKMRE
jgi:oxygen-dependent protoporphyrinogen oxidase